MGKQIFPDTYSVPVRIAADRPTTNPRYRHFTQTHFTAGDEEQFEQHVRKQDVRVTAVSEPQGTPRFSFPPLSIWSKYLISSDAMRHMFQYLFFKFKKGMLLQIRDGQLVTFLPFSNAFFVNEWHSRIHVPDSLLPSKTVLPVQQWYANNGLLRYESPCNETDTGACHMKNMFETLCQLYGKSLPDVDLFLNRRDFPLLKCDGTEPYHHMFDGTDVPLLSGAFDTYAPLLSSCTSDGFADLAIPTMDDWARVQAKHNLYFASTRRMMATGNDAFLTPWNKKKELAVFRGTNTGIGTDPETNVRLKLVVQFQHHPRCNVGLTAWNTRPRKVCGMSAIQIPRTDWVTLSGNLTADEQAMYKYIIHVPGHVQAYRLSIELAMRSVILLVSSPYRIWFEAWLEPWVHYVPVAADLSDLDERLTWCLEHDEECQAIATRARVFYETYLTRDGCLAYLKHVLDSVAQSCVPAQRPVAFSGRLRTHRLEQAYITYTQPPMMYPQKVLFKSVNTLIQLVHDVHGQPYVHKQSLRSIRYEHEFFVGVYCMNPLTRHLPNFVYTHALTNARGLYLEYTPGITMFDYLRSSTFQLNEWYFLMLQTFAAIAVAQRTCFFTHHDLCPWNIVLMRTSREQPVDYLLAPHTVLRVYTTHIPVILDYDKSHVVHELVQYVHFFGYQPYQDVLCLLVTCLYNILKHQRLRPEEQKQLLWLFSDALCDPVYCPQETIETVDDMVRFLQSAHRYAHISFAPKGALMQRSVERILRTLQTLHRPMFGQQSEWVDRVQYRFLRGVRPDHVQFTAATIDHELPPLLALHWKQWFHAFLPAAYPDDDPQDREPIAVGTLSFPELEHIQSDSLFAISPRLLQLWNLVMELYHDGGPYQLMYEERVPLTPYIQNDLKTRERMFAYAKHLTKIKLTRNIL